jgi:hypothetical protein
MGIYFQTRFYPNMSDSGTYTVLSAMNRVLDYQDMERGWVRAEDLLRIFPDKVHSTDLSTNSWVVEYMWSTHELNTEPKEVRRLPVH